MHRAGLERTPHKAAVTGHFLQEICPFRELQASRSSEAKIMQVTVE